MADVGSDRPVLALAAASVGVYVLVIAGATASIVDAVAACSAWPACGAASITMDDPQLLVALGHRILAVVVGIVVLWATVSAWSAGGPWVRRTLAATILLYPVQVGIGALVAVYGPGPLVTGFHLVVGMAIFVGLVTALGVLMRESYHGTIASESGPVERPAAAADAAAKAEATAPVETATAAEAPAGGLRATALAYLRMTKPRLMWLLCLVAAAGMALAAGPALTARTAVATLAGGVLAIGASGTFNQLLERDLDRRMQRTADRPLATDQVGPLRALAFGVALAVASVSVFASINLLAAALGLAAIAYYSVVYTLLLKPNTVQNTVIGGFAGSFPALIGAAAATNTVGPAALLLGAVIFLWTPAHFYNLALVYRDDYERGGVPMFPVVRGEVATRTHILAYLGATLLAAALLAAVAGLGPLYAVVSVVFGAIFLWTVVALHRRPSRTTAWRAFHASNAYLGAVLLAIVVDALAL